MAASLVSREAAPAPMSPAAEISSVPYTSRSTPRTLRTPPTRPRRGRTPATGRGASGALSRRISSTTAANMVQTAPFGNG